ncbi:NUDIX domain-containing protein [Chromatocurvus halotolerans]|uniref:ADP-ribose pyrophosphatase n=1 Tax=Chromatocurvus halotolerans TaxID=1132028 RepID=A0A4R2KLF1_9GAMM|nr:NUDIX domain-containing protein [Chromatocurvus halotolerans]TCO74871.1 ADP-ribose pyrophosphatase [Chromatocurvus halotolerans]
MSFRLRFGAADVRILDEQDAFSGHFRVARVTLEHRCFSGGWSAPLTREVFHRGDAVGVLPYEPETDSLILLEQFRPGALRGESSPWMLELVAGIVEAGESDADVVQREAMEEAGCELAELVPVASFFPSAGACSEHVRLFCGRVLRAGAGQVHGLDSEGEDILVHRIPRREALGLLGADRIANGHTLIALQWLALHGDRLRQRWLAAETSGQQTPE